MIVGLMNNRETPSCLVHFEGKDNWCAAVISERLNENTNILEIGSAALIRYNNTFRSNNFSIMECQFFVLNTPNSKPIFIAHPAFYSYNPGIEIILRLPNFQLHIIKPNLSQEDIDYYLDLGQSLYNSYAYASAIECFLLCGNLGQTLLEKLMPSQICDLYSSKTSLNSALSSSDSSMNILHKKPKKLMSPDKLQELYHECICVSCTPEQYRFNAIKLFKAEPILGIRLILRQPDLIYELPDLCVRTNSISILAHELQDLNCDESEFKEISQVFLYRGYIDESLALLSSSSTIISKTSTIARFYLYILLLDRQFGRFYTFINSFLSSSENYNSIYEIITSVRNFLPQAKPLSNSIHFSTPFKDHIGILIYGALFLFFSGCFAKSLELIDIIKTKFSIKDYIFERSHSIKPEIMQKSLNVHDLADFFINGIDQPSRELFMIKAVEFSISRLPSLNLVEQTPNNWKHDIIVIGDENAIHSGFQSISDHGTLLPVPIPGISIYHLRRESHSPLKVIFWNRIRECRGKFGILLVLGYNDIKLIAPKLVQYGIASGANDAFVKLAALYKDIVEQIHQIIPDLKIFIHSQFMDKNYVMLFRRFNEILENTLSGSCAQFLKIQSDMEPLFSDSKTCTYIKSLREQFQYCTL